MSWSYARLLPCFFTQYVKEGDEMYSIYGAHMDGAVNGCLGRC